MYRAGVTAVAENLKESPLQSVHRAAGARLIPFGGWLMPLQYQDILEEHRAVRDRAGLFDVSHMGEILVLGPGAACLLQGLLTNNALLMEEGQVIYSPMCDDDGGVLDDLLVYRLGCEEYMVVVNAANTARDLNRFRSRAGEGVEIRDLSGRLALLALQGPLSEGILSALAGPALPGCYRFARLKLAGVECIVSRTGYTGEDGFELYLEAGAAPLVWNALMEEGEGRGLVPAGLGARDTLRFEASLPLYGRELNEKTTPLEAGLGRFVKLDKGPFSGRDALVKQAREGLSRRLAGLSMVDRGIPRAQCPVLAGGRTAGAVTSGGYAPTLNARLALAYLPPEMAPGDRVAVLIRGKECGALVVPLPFYKRRV